TDLQPRCLFPGHEVPHRLHGNRNQGCSQGHGQLRRPRRRDLHGAPQVGGPKAVAKISRKRQRTSPETLGGKGVSDVMLEDGRRSRLLMPLAPLEYTLELIPKARVDVIDVRRRVSERFGDTLDGYKRVLCCSFHTTAGYLDQSLASRLNQSRTGVMPYIELFRTMFPEGAGDEHDKSERRPELTDEQRPEEPQNADSHLAFMAGALR